MGREISAQAPSFFFGVRDDRENAEFSYHSDYRGGIIDVDEITIVPLVAAPPVYVRRGDRLDDMSLSEAALVLAEAISRSAVMS